MKTTSELNALIARKREIRQHLFTYVVPTERKLALCLELSRVEDRIAEVESRRRNY